MTSFSKLEEHDLDNELRKHKELAEKKQRMNDRKKSIKETNKHIKKYTNWSNLYNLLKFM